ncbi:MAG: DNA replication and repair protein RecF [Sphaerochaetaceae bacterium]
MRFVSLRFHNFRNLKEAIVDTDSKNIVLLGANGQGKTNFLEALYLLCYGSSFRCSNIKEMVAHNKKEFRLSAVVESDDKLKQQLQLTYSEGKREIRIDGKEVKDRRQLVYNIPCIVFSHDDIEFVRGVPESRRRFFDQTMSLYDPLFFDDLRRYRSVLKQRNAAIKENLLSLVPIYNHQLATSGLAIQQKREAETQQFNKIFGPLYQSVSNSSVNLRISYRPSWKNCTTVEQIEEILSTNIERDVIMQTTTSGIHRDQFVVMQDKSQFNTVGSTGQMRLASLIFRIVQVQTYYKHTNKLPLLLVDDVLLELDLEKRALFLDLLENYSQAFFTFLPRENYFSKENEGERLTYKVTDGEFVKT